MNGDPPDATSSSGPASDRAAAIDHQIVEGYTRMPQGGEYDADEWGDLAALMAALTRDQQRQLTADERDTGFEPW
jgi:hypothetical protein